MTKKGTRISLARLSFIIAIIGAMLCVIIFVLATGEDKRSATKTMTDVADYVKEQCIRYDEIVAESAARDLIAVADKTSEMREEITSYAGDENLFRAIAERKRLTGVVLWDADKKEYGGYVPDGESFEEWATEIKVFASAADNPDKTYTERIFDQGYYYDYAVVGRSDVYGVILGFTRRETSSIESSQLSVRTLLEGYNFQSEGKVAVTDGTYVIAANDENLIGIAAEDCPVVQKLRRTARYRVLERAEGEKVYAIREKCKGYFIYVYMSEDAVFANRSLVSAYIVLFYFATLAAITGLQYRFMRTRTAEQNKKDAEYRKELDRLANEAIRANEVKTDFLRRMSHDVRTPINGIRGMIKIGEYYADDLERQKECRDKIWKASGYLLDLVNDVLDMTKLEAKDLPVKNENFSVGELVNDLNAVMNFQAGERGVTLTTSVTDVVHDELFGAATLLKRVCTNLIFNAIKYNKPNGRVDFTVREICGEEERVTLAITCADTGVGMSESFQKKMFEPFEQEASSADDRNGGTGLGLAIVKKAVEKMGGTIDAESKKGEGTTFTVKIPFLLATGAPVLSEEEECKEPLVGYNVLVVEDNDLNLEIAEFMLKTAGANVFTAQNGEEGINEFLSKSSGFFDAVVMDVMMPVKDGLEAAREIRLSGRADAAAVPIIAMTANAFYDDEERIKEAGMSGCVTKPLDAKKLVKTIVFAIENDGGGYLVAKDENA